MEYHCKYDELVDPASLKPHPKNANTHPDSQVEELGKAIDRVGWRLPVIVSRLSGYVVAGHCRRLTGMAREWEVPVEYQSFESEREELDFLMHDNLLPELAIWDEPLKLSNLEMLDLAPISNPYDPEFVELLETAEMYAEQMMFYSDCEQEAADAWCELAVYLLKKQYGDEWEEHAPQELLDHYEEMEERKKQSSDS